MEDETPVPFGKEVPKEQRDWAMFAHVSALAGYFMGAGVLNFVGPLVIWLMKREEMPFVNDQAKESLNFQITILLGLMLSVPLVFVIIGVFTAMALWVIGMVFTVIGAMKAQEGELYRYPFAIRLIS